MTLPNPFYIDAEARHSASVLRTLAWAAVEGKEGILHQSALIPTDYDIPGAGLIVGPGPFAVNCKHQGGSFESYVCKLPEAYDVSVNPVGSSGPRTDLVIARVENPYVDESSSWVQPEDELFGPYWQPRVIEGVTPGIQAVATHNAGWSAIPICRIDRPANTGIVLQSHITDLRSLAKLGGERVTIIQNPPVTPTPPLVAQPFFSESTPVGNDTQLLSTDTNWKDFPGGVSWNVPIPAWATGMDIFGMFNPTVQVGWAKGDTRLVVNGDPTNAIPVGWNANYPGAKIRDTLMIGGTESLGTAVRGKTINMKLQARMTGGGPGKLVCEDGTRINLLLNFKQFPVYDVFN